MRHALLILLTALFAACSLAQAQETRQFNRIAIPDAAQRLPPGARALASPQPVSPERIDEAVQAVVTAWNTPKLAPLLADYFYGKSRLLDALNTKVPRDAKLRVLSVQGMQTLLQYVQKNESGVEQLKSRVSVTVRTQVEYNDPQAGFQRLDGTNEVILIITEAAP